VSHVVGLDHVQLSAPPGCEAVARDFFGAVLGLAEVEKPTSLRSRGGVWFAAGAQQLHVGIEEAHAPALKAHPALAVRDAGAVAECLAAAGAPVTWDDSIPGVRRLYTADPWGNRLELVESARPPELLGERDER
jgi:catechol 2,3-dioxygenase-like lactoylglutathione lyase family enzyme